MQKKFTLSGLTGLARSRSGRDRAQLSQPDRAGNNGSARLGLKKIGPGRAARMPTPALETSDFDFCDLLNELFHMNKIFFEK